MSRSAKVVRNIAANWVGFAVNACVTLVLTPFVLHTLGEARYGVWVISSSIIGYYGLLDLGLRGSINQHLTRYLAVRDFEKASECMSTALAALVTLGVLFAILSVAAAYFSPAFFNFPDGMESEAFWCILIVGLTAALQFAFFPYVAVFTASQRFDLTNLIGVTTRLLTAICVYAALKNGYGLVGISLATCGVALLDYFVRWRVAIRLAPELRVAYGLVNRRELGALASFGVWTFLISINAYIYLHAQPLLIGALLPIAAVGHYALATGLAQQLNGALAPIGQVLYPAATSLYARSERETLERLYHDGTRLMLLAMVCAVSIAAFWAEDFYRLWIGAKYVEPSGTLPSVALLLQVLLGATVCGFTSNVAAQILMGSGRVRTVALLLICGSAINLGLSVVLLDKYGLLGASIATVAASFVIDLVAMPIALQRITGLRVGKMVRSSLPRPALVALVLAVLFWGLRSAGQATNWSQLLLHGFVAGSVALVVVLIIGVTRNERQRFLVQPLRRFLSRRHPAPAIKDAGGTGS